MDDIDISANMEQRYNYDSDEDDADSYIEEDGKALISDEDTSEDEVAAAADENYFPRIVAIFYSIFHPTKGPSVIYQVPEGCIAYTRQVDSNASEDVTKSEDGERSASVPSVSMEPPSFLQATASAPQQHEALFDFKNLSEYIIPRAPLCGRLITYSTTSARGESYKILSHPVLLSDQAKYPRNTFIFNLAFVFDGRADVRAYEPIVRKCARELRDLEQNTSFLSRSQYRMYGIIEQLFEDLNSYYESFVALPDVPHFKYISEAAKTAELLRDDKRARAPKVWQDPSSSPVSVHDQQRSLSTSSSASAERHLRITALTNVGHASRIHASTPPLSPLALDGSAVQGLNMPMNAGEMSPISPKAVRPGVHRSSTEATIVQSPPATSPPQDLDYNESRPSRKDSSASGSSTASAIIGGRPSVNRAKTFAALSLSGTTVSASNAQGTLTTDTLNSEQQQSQNTSKRSTPIRASFVSRSSSTEGSTNERELNQSIASLRAIDEHNRDGVDYADKGSPSRKTSSEHYQPEQNVYQPGAAGKREPPHGLGRRVRDALNVKLFPTYTNPKEVNDWDVPVMLLDLGRRISDNWDLTMRKVLPFIDGINHVKRIAQLADADLELTRQCVEHLLYYRCIIMIDVFQFSNLYTVRPTIATLADDEVIVSECAAYVTKSGYPMASWPKLLSLYSSLRPSLALNDWIEENDVDALGIDVRRFVTFGVIKGFLRRVHRFPVLLLGEACAQLDRKSVLTLGRDQSPATRREDRSRSPQVDSPVVASFIDRKIARDPSEGLHKFRSSSSLRLDDTASIADRLVSPERGFPSPSRRRADRQEASDEYAWMGAVYNSTSRDGSLLQSRSGRESTKAGSMRRRGLPHAPSAQLAHQHRPKRATVMDVANVAFDVAAKETSVDDGSLQRMDNRSKTFNLRSPLPRGQTPGSSRGSTILASRRDPLAVEEDVQSIGGVGRHTIPEGLIEMLDGVHPDDAFCVHFNRSWNEMMQLLVFIGVSLPAQTRSAAQAGQSGLTLRRGQGGGRSSIDMRNGADSSGIEQPAGDESGFPQMSGIWNVPGMPGRKSSVQGTNGATQIPAKNVTFPSLPRYRQASHGNEENGSGFERSGFNRYANSGLATSQRQSGGLGDPNTGSDIKQDERPSNAQSTTAQRQQKQTGSSMASSREGASFLLPLPEEFGYHERQRIMNGDVGRIQIIVK
jgi:hypothetical protein